MVPRFAVPVRPADRSTATDAPMDPLIEAFGPTVGVIEAAAAIPIVPVPEAAIPREAKSNRC
jgi:hypothetical protein